METTVIAKKILTESPLATINVDSNISIPDDFFITGETTLYGRVLRSGGVDPTVAISTGRGKILYCPVSQEIAQRLGKGLYLEIGLKGIAKWLKEDYSIISFTINDVFDLDRNSIAESISELSTLIGKYWRGVDDVNAEISKLRGA